MGLIMRGVCNVDMFSNYNEVAKAGYLKEIRLKR
jgi:hypothetical protein